MSFKAIVAMLLFSVALSLSAATEVIPLNYRQAEEMLDIARSVVADQGRVAPTATSWSSMPLSP